MAVLAGCGQAHPGALMSLSPIVIPLGKPPANVSGFTWLENRGNSSESVTIRWGGYVSLVFPSGRRWTSWSRLTFADQEKGIVYRAVITPLRKTASFDDALRNLSTAIDELGVPAGFAVHKTLAALRKEPPEWDSFSTQHLGCHIESGVELYAKIRPASDANRWYLSYDFISAEDE
jgi:hypothetical protein